MFNSTGKLVYDPTLAYNVKTTQDPFWLILECDPELARYYRYLTKRYFSLDWLMRPAWGAHVSVIRGEKVTKPELWAKDKGRQIKFEYTGEVRTNGRHYWLDISCPELLHLRKQYGLNRNPVFGKLHLTIGNCEV